MSSQIPHATNEHLDMLLLQQPVLVLPEPLRVGLPNGKANVQKSI